MQRSLDGSDVVAVFVGEEHAVRVAFREEARLPKGNGGTNTTAFADDADAPLGWAMVMRAMVEKHPAAALGTSLFR